MASSRHQVLIRAEVAKWKALEAPYGATQAEIEACRARRTDYAERLVAGVTLFAEREGFLSVLGRVLGRVGATPPSMGVPEVSSLVRRVRDELEQLERPANSLHPEHLPRCARCVREGGITLYGRRHDPQRAAIAPGHVMRDGNGRGQSPREPLCGHQVELAAWEAMAGKADPPYPAPAWTRPNTGAAKAAVERLLQPRQARQARTKAAPSETVRQREPGDDSDEIDLPRSAPRREIPHAGSLLEPIIERVCAAVDGEVVDSS